MAAMGVDPARPLVSQISRFDIWKDPWGVIKAFRLAREEVPGLQLAMLGLSQAGDDPEALDTLASVKELAAGDPDIHLYFHTSDLPASIDELVNAFQVASKVVVQKSVQEGFGLSVTEAMWKRQPVIGGNVGGIRVQIDDGVNGFLVDSFEECAIAYCPADKRSPVARPHGRRRPGVGPNALPHAWPSSQISAIGGSQLVHARGLGRHRGRQGASQESC